MVQSCGQVVEDHSVKCGRASVVGEHVALDSADLYIVFIVDVVEEVEQATSGEFGMQEHAQQSAFRSQFG